MADATQSFDNFLVRLGDVLDRRAADDRPARVVFDPARRGPSAAGEVLVGLGAWLQGEVPVAHEGVCLNNKGAAARFGLKREPLTVASFIRNAPNELVAEWRVRFGTDPEAALDHATLVVEDASPDSVLSVIFWLARLAGVDPEEMPQRWITALTVWERDGIAPSVTRSWTSLLSALAHSHFGSGFDGQGIDLAWSDALRFTVMLLRDGVDPNAVDPDSSPGVLADPGYGRAIAFAMNERQDYLQSLGRAVTLELLVPMAGSPGRVLLVDAYFATEPNAPSGVKKIFIRTDTEHTSFGNGFSLMGLYRPGLEGSGNDMTISVDPRAGIALRDLWHELEALENRRWDGARPNAVPRRIASYPTGGYDQPWWDDHGRYTLLGAPKRVSAEALGSKLSWDDVLEAVWRCYNPLRDVVVFDLNDTGSEHHTVPIGQCRARPVISGTAEYAVSKNLVAVKWDRSDAGRSKALQFTTTVKRQMAAMVGETGAVANGVQLKELLDPEEFDFVELSGGFALVTRDGAFLFDDWRDRDLPVTFLSGDFSETVALLSACKRFEAEVNQLYADADIGSTGLYRNNTAQVLSRIVALRAQIAAAFQKADASHASPERRQLRQALASRWGLDGREEGLTTRLKDLQEILETMATLQTQGMAQLIGIVAIPNFVVALMALYVGTVSAAAGDTDYSYALWMSGLVALISLVFLVVAIFATRGRD